MQERKKYRKRKGRVRQKRRYCRSLIPLVRLFPGQKHLFTART